MMTQRVDENNHIGCSSDSVLNVWGAESKNERGRRVWASPMWSDLALLGGRLWAPRRGFSGPVLLPCLGWYLQHGTMACLPMGPLWCHMGHLKQVPVSTCHTGSWHNVKQGRMLSDLSAGVSLSVETDTNFPLSWRGEHSATDACTQQILKWTFKMHFFFFSSTKTLQMHWRKLVQPMLNILCIAE